MRKTIVTLGLGLLLASPAFAAKPHKGAVPAAAASTKGKKAVTEGAGEAKPAEGAAKEPKKGKGKGHKGGKKAEGEAKPEAAPAK